MTTPDTKPTNLFTVTNGQIRVMRPIDNYCDFQDLLREIYNTDGIDLDHYYFETWIGGKVDRYSLSDKMVELNQRLGSTNYTPLSVELANSFVEACYLNTTTADTLLLDFFNIKTYVLSDDEVPSFRFEVQLDKLDDGVSICTELAIGEHKQMRRDYHHMSPGWRLEDYSAMEGRNFAMYDRVKPVLVNMINVATADFFFSYLKISDVDKSVFYTMLKNGVVQIRGRYPLNYSLDSERRSLYVYPTVDAFRGVELKTPFIACSIMRCEAKVMLRHSWFSDNGKPASFRFGTRM